MIFYKHIDPSSAFKFAAPKHVLIWVFLFLLSPWLSGCATKAVTTTAQLEAYSNAFTVPYRISDEGHLIVDVGVNGQPAKPFIIDSGANISAIFEKDIAAFDLTESGNSTSVSGLVTTAIRPLAENLTLQIGTKTYQRDRIVILKNPSDSTENVGLLGVDMLGDYGVLFNKTEMTASFIPSTELDRDSFSGWRRIPLKNNVRSFPDKGLYFATILIEGNPSPVLIDTGSNLNLINWELATRDPQIAKLRRKLRKSLRLAGANDSTPLRLRSNFYDVQLGTQHWPEVDVLVLEFDTLNEIAPVDRPMMLAGAGMFTSSTFVFDFGGDAIYIQPSEAKP